MDTTKLKIMMIIPWILWIGCELIDTVAIHNLKHKVQQQKELIQETRDAFADFVKSLEFELEEEPITKT